MIQINPAVVSMFGILDPLDLVRYSYKDDPNIPDSIKKRIENREAFTAEMTYDISRIRSVHNFRTTGSDILHIRIMVTPVTFSVSGMRDGFYILIEDITARHQIESELRRMTQKLARIMDASNDGFFFYQVHNETITISPRLNQMLGLSRIRRNIPF